MIRISGAALGLLGFFVAVVQGMAADNPVEVVLVRAIWALMIMCGLGLVVGWVANRVLDEHAVARHQEMFKVIEEPPGASAPADISPPGARPDAIGQPSQTSAQAAATD